MKIARIAAATAVLAGPFGGCAPRASDPAPPARASILTALAGSRVVVFPVQVPEQSAANAPSARSYAAALNDSLEAAIMRRGVSGWALPRAVVAMGARHRGILPDPARLSTAVLRTRRTESDDPLDDGIGSQTRAYVALHGGRYAIVPLLLSSGTVRFALVDTRTARVRWTRELPADSADSAAGAGHIAEAFAMLVVPRGD